MALEEQAALTPPVVLMWIVMGFDSSDDAIQSIGQGELKATSAAGGRNGDPGRDAG